MRTRLLSADFLTVAAHVAAFPAPWRARSDFPGLRPGVSSRELSLYSVLRFTGSRAKRAPMLFLIFCLRAFAAGPDDVAIPDQKLWPDTIHDRASFDSA